MGRRLKTNLVFNASPFFTISFVTGLTGQTKNLDFPLLGSPGPSNKPFWFV